MYSSGSIWGAEIVPLTEQSVLAFIPLYAVASNIVSAIVSPLLPLLITQFTSRSCFAILYFWHVDVDLFFTYHPFCGFTDMQCSVFVSKK
jgi:hypothetical protein